MPTRNWPSAQAQAEKEGAEAAKEQAKAEKEAAKDAEKLRKEQEKAAAASKKHGEQLKHAIGGQIKSIIGKISMLGIALLGVRSAWQLIRSAINDVKSTNEYVSGQIDGFKNMLATAIEPLIVQIVQWLSTAVTYVNAFIAALTGVDLIANANARAINKQAKATAGAAKAAAQLAGFDEMNKLSDNSGGGGGGGASGMFQPADIDTSAVEGFVNRIKQIIDESGIGAKIQEFLDKFSGLDLEAIFKPIKDVAVLLIGDALQNALDLIDDVLDLLLDIQSGNVLGVICDIFMLMWDLGTGWMRPLLAIIDGLFGTDTLGFYKEMRSALNKFMDLLGHASSWQEFFDGVVEIAMTHPHIKALSEAIAKVITFIRNLGVTVISTAGNIFSPVIAAIGKLWSWIDKNAIQPIKTFLSGFWQNQISPVLSKLWEITGTVAKIATALFKAAETYVLQPIGRWIAGLWQKFVDNVLKPVQTWATGVGAWI